jgi:hypothetical protein
VAQIEDAADYVAFVWRLINEVSKGIWLSYTEIAMGRRRPPDFIEEIKAKQRNTVWPEMLANSRAVDSLAFLGDRNATPVQRIGIGLFGAFFVLAGIAFIGIGRDLHSILPFLVSFVAFLLGGLVLFNAVRGMWSRKRG